MASGGFYSGLGQGLQGMAQNLSEFLVRRQRKQETDRDQGNWQKQFDESVRRDDEQRSYQKRQEARQTSQDEEALLEKVLSNITGPTRVSSEFAAKAKQHPGLDTFVSEAPAVPLINPVTHTPMGGAPIPAGSMARPMISPRDQAAIDASKSTADNREAMMAFREAQLAQQGQRNEALAGYQMGMLGLGQQNVDLRGQVADFQRQLQGARLGSQNEEAAWKDAMAMAKQSFNMIDTFAPDYQDKLMQRTQEIYSQRKMQLGGAMQGGKETFAPPNPGIESLMTPAKMPMDPSMMPAPGPSYKDQLIGGLTSTLLPRSFQKK